MRRIITLLAVLSGFVAAYSQQDPLYTQYFFNKLGYNPAYAGHHDMMSSTVVLRKQWVDFNGSPATGIVSANSSLKNNHLGAGINIVRETFGISGLTEVNAAGAYKIKGLAGQKLSFGLQAGVLNYSYNLGDKDLNSESDLDDKFSESNSINSTKPNLGLGLLYSADKYYVGFSAPRLAKITFESAGVATNLQVKQHFYLTAGYLFKVGQAERLKFRPSILMRFFNSGTGSSPALLDWTGSFIYMDALVAGISFRNTMNNAKFESISLFGEFQVSDVFKAGFAYEASVSQKHFGNPTFEVVGKVSFAAFDFQSVQVTYF